MRLRGLVAHFGPGAGTPGSTEVLGGHLAMMLGGSGGSGSREICTRALPLSGPFRHMAAAVAGEEDGWVVGTHPPSGVVVVADAVLYYQEDLLRRLRARRVQPRSAAPADLIAATICAFGARAPQLLEGDFAFVAWDPAEERLLLARDPFGLRPLFYRQEGGGVAVATLPPGAAGLTGWGSGLPYDREGALRSTLFRPGSGEHSAITGVRELPAGCRILLPDPSASPTARRYWDAAPDQALARASHAEAAEYLGHLIRDASAERVVPGRTALALSGGQDSTAVLGALRAPGSPHVDEPVRLLSLGYPAGDRGDERLYIEAVSHHVSLPIQWIDTGDIPLFEGVAARARGWSHPFGHSFEGQNLALAAAAREGGSTVLLTGHGGDNVFFVSDDVMMADLLLGGRLPELRRAFRSRGYAGAHHFWRYCLRPALAPEFVAVVGGAVGRAPLAWPGERSVPPWVSVDPAAVHALLRESRARYREIFHARHRTRTGASRAWMILDPLFTQVTANLHAMVRRVGVDLRAPLLDRRLVEFALSRPTEEFNRPGEGKVLLREAMRGRLPDLLVDPRPSRYKTGVPTEYFGRRFPAEVRRWVDELGVSTWLLDEAGIIDSRSLARLARGSDGLLSAWHFDLVCTLSTETWLRSIMAPNLRFKGPDGRIGLVRGFGPSGSDPHHPHPH